MPDTPTGYSNDAAVVIHSWPAELRANGHQCHLQANTTSFASPFTRTVQTQELPGAVFRLSKTLPPMQRDRVRLARAFLAKLRGSAGRYYDRAEDGSGPIPAAGDAEAQVLVPLTCDSERFTCDATFLTCDATQVPAQNPIEPTGSGTDPTVIEALIDESAGTVILQAGQHISFDDASGWRRLHLVVEDAVVQAGGVLHITVEPPLRERPAFSAPIHVRVPSGIFMLADDQQGALLVRVGNIAELAIDAVEAPPPTFVITP